MAMTQAKLVETLETLIDSETLATVVGALHLVCLEKAEHIRCAWQDEMTAKTWDRAAKALYAASANNSVEAVS